MLKAVYDTLDEVPESYRDLYSGEAGVGFRLTGVEGILLESDHANLKNALNTERARANNLEKKVKDFSNLDMTKYREWESRVPELETALEAANKDRATAINAAVEERIAPVMREKENVIKELQGNLEKATAELQTLHNNLKERDFNERFRAEAPKYHVQDGAIEDVVFRAKSFGWQLDNAGNLIALNTMGDPQYSRKNPTKEMSFAEWISEVLPQEAPHLFKSSTGGGATGGAKGVKGKAWSEMTTSERSNHISDAVARGENIQEFIRKNVVVNK